MKRMKKECKKNNLQKEHLNIFMYNIIVMVEYVCML